MSARFQLIFEYYDGKAALWVAIPNATEITWNWGRRTITEPKATSTATIVGRLGNSFPELKIGQLMQFKIDDTVKGGTVIFGGQLSDLKVNYGMVPNMDTYEINMEGPWARAGRYIDDFVLTAGNSTAQAWGNFSETLPPPGQDGVFSFSFTQNAPAPSPAEASTSKVSAYSENTSLANVLQLIADTEVGRIVEVQLHDSTDQDIDLQLRQNLQQFPVNFFTDEPVNWGITYKYDRLEFRALSDTYGDRIEIDPTALPIASAGTGTRTQRFSSVDQTSLQAQAHAEYVLNLFTSLNEVPYSITSQALTQEEDDLINYFSQFINGYKINVTFRSVVYAAIVEGGQGRATPDNVVGTLFLSSQDQNAYLVLDDTTFGKLDQNKLGF
jgi:hypothetical protein